VKQPFWNSKEAEGTSKNPEQQLKQRVRSHAFAFTAQWYSLAPLSRACKRCPLRTRSADSGAKTAGAWPVVPGSGAMGGWVRGPSLAAAAPGGEGLQPAARQPGPSPSHGSCHGGIPLPCLSPPCQSVCVRHPMEGCHPAPPAAPSPQQGAQGALGGPEFLGFTHLMKRPRMP